MMGEKYVLPNIEKWKNQEATKNTFIGKYICFQIYCLYIDNSKKVSRANWLKIMITSLNL